MWFCWLHQTVTFSTHWGSLQPQCEGVGMTVSTSKSEAMVLCQKMVDCSLRVGSVLLPQVKEFKYLGILFTSEGKMECEMDRRIGSDAGIVPDCCVKRYLLYVPNLTYGHELWVVTERTRSRIQAAEMTFLCRVAGLSLRDRVRSLDIRRELRIELLLRVEGLGTWGTLTPRHTALCGPHVTFTTISLILIFVTAPTLPQVRTGATTRTAALLVHLTP
ncbi:hypothetical protein N1851_004048 [Merluccius polli]|uniref:Uncharacterized protein n=1 Tax=Merluccius polli TaxID=89951 RepID=A0AA47P7E2_MERPO|nr:hypothetical protein N1851_004048 [Merluccius polli]